VSKTREVSSSDSKLSHWPSIAARGDEAVCSVGGSVGYDLKIVAVAAA
jgi:hypothetical protein